MTTHTWLHRLLLGFDLETTGPDPFSDVPVSVAFVGLEATTVLVDEHILVNPGRPIPPGATAIHGITDGQVAMAPHIDVALKEIVTRIEAAADDGTPIVGMNVCFDLTIVDRLHRERTGGQGLRLGPVVDVLVLDRHLDRWRKGRRTLTALCGHYGVENAAAHDASGDARATLGVLAKMAERYPEIGTTALGDLHQQQVRAHRQWADGFDAYLRRQGKPGLDQRDGNWPIR